MFFGIAHTFELLLTPLTFKLLLLIMSVPVSQLTVEQAHKEFNSLVDKIAAKYEQLDSGEFGAVGILGFNAKSSELSQQCQRLNLPNFTNCHS